VRSSKLLKLFWPFCSTCRSGPSPWWSVGAASGGQDEAASCRRRL